MPGVSGEVHGAEDGWPAVKCVHGQKPGQVVTYSWRAPTSITRLVAKHRQTCPSADPFWHQGLIFKSVCCATCGGKIY